MPSNKLSSNVYQIYFKEFGSCAYLLKIGKDNILIDTSSKENGKELLRELTKLGVDLRDVHIILLTHTHDDHIGNLDLFPNAKVYDSKNIEESALIMIKFFRVPGHTKDSLAFLHNDILFSGDTLFHNGIGRTDLPESEPNKMKESLELLKKLEYSVLAPGHI